MPTCLLLKCGRTEIPAAPATPFKAKIACAHVMPNGEPCPDSPTAMYDLETLKTIVEEDKLWDLGPDVEPIQAREPKKPDRRSEPRRRDDKRKIVVAANKKAPEPSATDDDHDEVDDWDPDR